MKKVLLCAIVLLLTLFSGMWTFSSQFREKVVALGGVGGTLISADCNQVPVVKCGAVVLRAKHNVETVARAADYLVAVGGNTQVFMEIARIAAEASDECPRLNDVLDLAVMKQSESMRVLALAKSACSLQRKTRFLRGVANMRPLLRLQNMLRLTKASPVGSAR